MKLFLIIALVTLHTWRAPADTVAMRYVSRINAGTVYGYQSDSGRACYGFEVWGSTGIFYGTGKDCE